MGNQQIQCGKFIGAEIEGQTRVLRNASLGDDEDLCKDFQGMATIPQLFKNSVAKTPNANLFGTRRQEGTDYFEYEWTSVKTAYELSHSFAKSLFVKQLCPEKHIDNGDFRFIGLYAKNRAEWCLSDLGAALCGVTVVTLYDTLGK
jgi:long-subunit acyl-CoA synthetase (AMP-forming)